MKGNFQRKSLQKDVVKVRRAHRGLRLRSKTDPTDKALNLVANEAGLAEALKRLLDKGRGHIFNASPEESS